MWKWIIGVIKLFIVNVECCNYIYWVCVYVNACVCLWCNYEEFKNYKITYKFNYMSYNYKLYVYKVNNNELKLKIVRCIKQSNALHCPHQLNIHFSLVFSVVVGAFGSANERICVYVWVLNVCVELRDCLEGKRNNFNWVWAVCPCVVAMLAQCNAMALFFVYFHLHTNLQCK